ncbi:hypothetical protein DS885_06910 [Psychromonas sp. B3M02]|nr:hypothetical protein DS885_06910 [Psychromonas sp. B3M02]
MQYLSRLLIFCRQYQTRQQLNHLPRSVIKDIGKSHYQIDKELSKNSIKHIVCKGVNTLFLFITGRL